MTTTSAMLPAERALDALRGARPVAALDVRSPGEFAEGSIAGFSNLPILDNDERQQVGTCYKQQGQQAAIDLGFRLTAAVRATRVAAWSQLAASVDQPLMVCCWRGGLRSSIACDWLREAGVSTLRVEGGYKAMRQLLRARIDDGADMLILSGATGSGKTLLLRALDVPRIDLEALANHRGSAFGRMGEQPSQQRFENDLGLALWRNTRTLLLEDESRLIGRRDIPPHFAERMKQSPVVVLDVPMPERIALTFEEYVAQPLRRQLQITPDAGSAQSAVCASLLDSFARIRNRLGHERHERLTNALRAAMTSAPFDVSAHAGWIAPLLADYYDPLYQHAFSRQQRKVVFRGDRDACANWLRERLGSAE